MIQENQQRKQIKADIESLHEKINELQAEIRALYVELRKPVAWLENTSKRIILTDSDVVKLLAENKAMVDHLFSNDITVERDGDKAYIYVNYIEAEHLAALESINATIETNENI